MRNKNLLYGFLAVVLIVTAGSWFLFSSYSTKLTVPTDIISPGRTEAVTTVSGYVVSGGDTTPEGLFDTPRRFIYKIKTDSGSFINVAYIAYPPSPVGDEKKGKIGLSFHAGTINIGDYLKSRGTYRKETNTLTVAGEDDYIETYFRKP